MDQVDNENLILRKECDIRSTRSHNKKLRKGRCLRDIKRYSFLQRCVETWNSLSEEVVSATNWISPVPKCSPDGYHLFQNVHLNL
ncbi:hypothetical protein E2C01_062186 [Portunus trituberculatus]|uniref:Uncharacterized protein n=1 Tax=Portunus trituberculatus TaxID=210409 RepID=A0A5B7HFF2_PORTR|nr:hypothetical protein [Portunus trituberculatus]